MIGQATFKSPARPSSGVSRREQEKKRSLDALSRIAYTSPGAPAPVPKPAPAPAAARAPAAPRPTPKAPPTPAANAAARARGKQLEERREKLEEEKLLRTRRAKELARGSRLEWRGGGFTDIPASIRRTGFDRDEPSTSQKIHDVLGDPREKDGRTKAKSKGKRQGGR